MPKQASQPEASRVSRLRSTAANKAAHSPQVTPMRDYLEDFSNFSNPTEADPEQQGFAFPAPVTSPLSLGPPERSANQGRFHCYLTHFQLPGGRPYELEVVECPITRSVLSYRLTPALPS